MGYFLYWFNTSKQPSMTDADLVLVTGFEPVGNGRLPVFCTSTTFESILSDQLLTIGSKSILVKSTGPTLNQWLVVGYQYFVPVLTLNQ